MNTSSVVDTGFVMIEKKAGKRNTLSTAVTIFQILLLSNVRAMTGAAIATPIMMATMSFASLITQLPYTNRGPMDSSDGFSSPKRR